MKMPQFTTSEKVFIFVFYGLVALGIYAHLFLTVYERHNGLS